jgi:dipeptide/tripeptide permease
MVAAVLAFLTVLLLYRDPESTQDPNKPRRTIPEVFFGMFKVLRSGRFVMFLVVSSGFYFIYNQVYNVLPLYVKKTVELTPAMDLYTMANPITIVLFQLLITKLFGKMPPIKSIIVGTVIIGLSMLINVAPLYMAGGVTMKLWLPLGSLFVVMTVALIAFGELFASSRLYEYIGSLAPKGQEGLFLGYANLPMAIGSLVGGPAGAWLFNKVMCEGAVAQADGLLKLDPKAAATGWIILTLFGLGSALSLWVYNRWLQRQPA